MFPTGSTKQHKITIPSTKVEGSADLTYFPVVLTEDSFLSDIFSNTQGQELASNFLGSDSNLQGYWKMEDDYTDSSGNGYNLTASNSPVFTASGKFTKALDLEAGSSQYASIADGSCPNLEITGSQTFSCWFKPESITSFQVLMAKSTAATAHHDLYFNSSGTVTFRLNGLTTNTSVDSTPKLTAGYWHHIAGVYDSAEKKLKVWINGVKTEVTASGSATDTNGAFYIGRNGDGNYLDGVIDDIAVFNRALKDYEIEAIYRGGCDLRFTSDEDGNNILPHYVVNWDIDNSLAKVVVGYPTLQYNSNNLIHVWGGNSSQDKPYELELEHTSLRDSTNLKGYYRFNNDATDELGNNDLTLANSPVYTTDTPYGSHALDLEASSNQVAYHDTPSADLQITGAMTINARIKIESQPGTSTLYQLVSMRNESSGKATYQFIYEDDSGTKKFHFFHRNSSSQAESKKYSYTLPTGKWVDVAVTITSGGVVDFHVDGEKVGSGGTLSYSRTHDSGADFCVGARDKSGTNQPFDGVVDELSLFNTNLSQRQLRVLHRPKFEALREEFQLVLHHDSNIFVDYTHNRYYGSNNGSVSVVAGALGNANEFNGSSQYIDFGDIIDPSALDDVWLESYANADSLSSTHPMIAKQQSGVSNGYFLRGQSSDEVRFSLKDASDHSLTTSDSPFPTGSYKHIVGRWDKTTMRVQVNGAVNTTTTSYSSTPSDNSQPLQIGAFTGDSVYFDGKIQETRIADTDFGEDWAKTTYNNLNDPSTFAVASSYVITQALSDSVSTSESLFKSIVNPLTDSISNSETFNNVIIFSKSLSDSVSTAVDIIFSTSKSLLESLGVTSTLQKIGTFFKSLTDSATATDSSTNQLVSTKEVSDTTTITSSISTLWTRGLAIAETIVASSIKVFSLSRSVTDSSSTSEDLTKVKTQNKELTDSPTLSDSISYLVTVVKELTETVIINDPRITKFLNGVNLLWGKIAKATATFTKLAKATGDWIKQPKP